MTPAQGSKAPKSAVDQVLGDLADWGWKANIPGVLIPIPKFADELAQTLAPLDRFELVSDELEGPMHRVVLNWSGRGAMADLAADFFPVVAAFAHDPALFVHRRVAEDAVEYFLVMGTDSKDTRADTYIAQFRLIGPGVEEIARWARERK